MRKKGQGKYRGTDNVAVIRCADGKGWGREDGWNVLVGANGGAIIKNYDENGNLTGLTIIAAKRFLKAKEEERSEKV